MPLYSLDHEEADEEAHEGGWDLETALDHVGIGRFQWLALAVCGLANAADAVEILAVSLVLPAAEDDLALTPASKSALSSCIFLGMLLGGLLWGPMGDVLGRRISLTVSLVLNASFGLLSAAARNVTDLVLLRLMAGVGVGGSVPVVFSFLAELLPAHARGKFMVGLAAHWMVGSIYSAGLGWALIPTAGWRVFLVVASLPAWLSAAANLLMMPESPRYLLVQGRAAEAEQALRHMAAINRQSWPSNVRLLHHEGHLAASNSNSCRNSSSGSGGGGDSAEAMTAGSRTAQKGGAWPTPAAAAGTAGAAAAMDSNAVGGSSSSTRGCCSIMSLLQGCLRGVRTSAATARQLLRPPLRRRFLPLLVAWLGMCGGWYSTVLWIPEYFKARGAEAASLYGETFAVAAANLPGNIASIFLVDWLGRRWTACGCLAGSCACALLFAAAPASPVWSVVAACIFNAISVGGWNALDLLSAELFPTEVRSTAMGMLGATGRLASFSTTFLAGALMQLQLWLPLVVAAGLLAAGSFAMLLLPEMALQPLEDTIEDAAAVRSGPRSATSFASSTRGGRGLSSSSALANRAGALRHSAALELQGSAVATVQPASVASPHSSAWGADRSSAAGSAGGATSCSASHYSFGGGGGGSSSGGSGGGGGGGGGSVLRSKQLQKLSAARSAEEGHGLLAAAAAAEAQSGTQQ